MITLFELMIGHAVCDFSLQTDSMAKGKNRHNQTVPPPGAKYAPSWYFWLLAHALIHAGAVLVVTHNHWCALAEFALHTAIDFSKCENHYGMKTDQALHALCKVAYVLMAS